MQRDYVVQLTGTAGTPLLLLPGGAAPSRGFFPGLDRLDGHRVIALDRPGTGLAEHTGRATLRTGADAAAQALREAGGEPAVVVAQSLGGAVAVQLAVDHPDVVSGLVLIDPTPFNDPGVCRQAHWSFEVLALPSRLPVVGRRLDAAIWRRLSSKTPIADNEAARAGLQVLVSISSATTAKAVRSLVAEGAALTPRLRPLGIPLVLMTADRTPDHRVRRAHQRLVDTLGGRLVSWPGAVHAEQLRRPDKILELVTEVVTEVVDGAVTEVVDGAVTEGDQGHRSPPRR